MVLITAGTVVENIYKAHYTISYIKRIKIHLFYNLFCRTIPFIYIKQLINCYVLVNSPLMYHPGK